jgi:cytochrome c oxidase subunit IV
MDEKKKAQAYEKGLIVLIVLAVLTIGELWFALFGITWWSILILIALGKAFLVVRDYMHIGRLFAGEEEH